MESPQTGAPKTRAGKHLPLIWPWVESNHDELSDHISCFGPNFCLQLAGLVDFILTGMQFLALTSLLKRPNRNKTASSQWLILERISNPTIQTVSMPIEK